MIFAKSNDKTSINKLFQIQNGVLVHQSKQSSNTMYIYMCKFECFLCLVNTISPIWDYFHWAIFTIINEWM